MTSPETSTQGEAETAPVAKPFSELGLDDAVLKALKDVGYETPSRHPGRHHPAAARRAATSSASPRPAPARPRRSRCRSSPASTCRRRRPQALVLAPTRELALQVCEAFEKYAAHLQGRARAARSTAARATASSCRALRRGVHVVVGTPGRIMDHLDKGTLDLSELQVPRARRGRRDAQDGLRRGRRDDPRRHPRRQAGRAVLGDDAGADPPDLEEVPATTPTRSRSRTRPRPPPTSPSAT